MRELVGSFATAWDETGNGPVLVCLHGFPFHRGLWAELTSRLAPDLRVIAPDLRGCGDSEPRPEPHTVDALADDVAALLDHLGVERAVLAGHSMGGYVALAFARRHPGRLRGLVLVASRAIADTAEQAAGRRAMAARVRRENPAFVAEVMLPRMLAEGSRDESLQRRARALMEPLRPEGIAACQLAMASRPDSSPLLGDVTAPALVVAGERDQVVPLAESGIVAANFRQGRLEVVAGAGHLPMLERPAETATAMRRWILGLEA